MISLSLGTHRQATYKELSSERTVFEFSIFLLRISGKTFYEQMRAKKVKIENYSNTTSNEIGDDRHTNLLDRNVKGRSSFSGK